MVGVNNTKNQSRVLWERLRRTSRLRGALGAVARCATEDELAHIARAAASAITSSGRKVARTARCEGRSARQQSWHRRRWQVPSVGRGWCSGRAQPRPPAGKPVLVERQDGWQPMGCAPAGRPNELLIVKVLIWTTCRLLWACRVEDAANMDALALAAEMMSARGSARSSRTSRPPSPSLRPSSKMAHQSRGNSRAATAAAAAAAAVAAAGRR